MTENQKEKRNKWTKGNRKMKMKKNKQFSVDMINKTINALNTMMISLLISILVS